eukprot:COSAG01_NODE_24753_length_767_cov_4.368263_1_plen_90_part_10
MSHTEFSQQQVGISGSLSPYKNAYSISVRGNCLISQSPWAAAAASQGFSDLSRHRSVLAALADLCGSRLTIDKYTRGSPPPCGGGGKFGG